jgi:hypothetical protein
MIVIVLWLCVVDETGEFRLWDVSIAERSSEPTPAVTLQIFEMHQGEPPLNKFKFLLVPNNLKRSHPISSEAFERTESAPPASLSAFEIPVAYAAAAFLV